MINGGAAITDLHAGAADLALVEATSIGVPLRGPNEVWRSRRPLARLRAVLRLDDECRSS
ncbi:MAG TPA: hypothetical protein VFZ70_01850 [Euzebyales bacterium]